ncbi:MAG: hypothetical protein LQ341_002815 [Variospora aurantia]|nr:MAG: hypothetical protein LQ341_002815 [Variospora aurantia]
MSAKLDMALDDVVMTERTARRRGRGGRRAPTAGRKATAPVGGIQKNTKATKGPMKPVIPNGLASGGRESKIIVSNLPADVTEKNVKGEDLRSERVCFGAKTYSCFRSMNLSISEQSSENSTDYFSDTIGPVKRVTISYGPNGVNKGIVTIIFAKPDSAAKALETLNGVQVDKRPMKIEVVLDAAKAVAAVPSKGLSDRITPGKGPKSATAAKTATDGTATRGRGGRGRATGRRGRNAGRGKPKTADELDAEMVDYFDPSNTNGAVTEGSGAAAATANGATQPAATLEDAGMDEISVSSDAITASSGHADQTFQ